MISTNLDETNTILGAGHKLGEAIREAVRRHRPRAIFVTASCASGIIGEDIDSVISEAEKEFGIPIGKVDCVGFRSEVWASGFDAAFDALLRKVIKPAAVRRPELVNVVCFSGTRKYLSDLLEPAGFVANPIVQFLSIEQVERLSEAGATAYMCPTLGTWLGAGLQERFGVPQVTVPPPFGLEATDRWLRELGRVTGRTQRIERAIESERAAVAGEVERLRAQLSGRTAFVAAGSAQGHNFISALRDLGVQIIGGCSLHHDPVLDHGDGEDDTLANATRGICHIPYGVCNKQLFQLINLVNRLRPDILVIRHPGMMVWGAKLGIPTVYVEDEHFALGYRGLVRYGRKILDWTRNPSLAKRAPLPFTSWWMEQEPFHFLEAR